MPLIIPSNSISGEFEVANSLRFDQASNDYLNITLGTATNDKIWTFSCWVKRSTDSANQQHMFFGSGGNADNNWFQIQFNASNQIQLSGYSTAWLKTNRLFRDQSAWYHVVVQADSTQATASDRLKLYVNGTQETSFGTDNRSSITQNQTWGINKAVGHSVGSENPGSYMDGYMCEVVFIDGSTLAPTSFGEFDEDTGIWKPISVSGLTFGTNGFYLDFESSGSLGNDVSGNGNNFTVNNLTSIDQTTDTPTNNYATANSLDNNSNSTYSNGNTTIATGASEYAHTSTTLGVSSGKYYCEVKYISGVGGARIGIAGKTATSSTDGLNGGNYEIYYENNGNLDVEGTLTSSWGSTYTTGDIIGIGLDLDNNKIYFSKNGTWQNSADPSAGTGGETISSASSTTAGVYFFSISDNTSSGVLTVSYNFGNGYFGTTAVSSAENPDDGIGIFEHTPPTGYKALCTKSINAQEYD